MLAGAEDFIPHNTHSLQGPQTPKITQIRNWSKRPGGFFCAGLIYG